MLLLDRVRIINQSIDTWKTFRLSYLLNIGRSEYLFFINTLSTANYFWFMVWSIGESLVQANRSAECRHCELM